MLDLYLALDSKGAELRASMLTTAADFLTAEQKTLFSSHQKSGIKRSQSLPSSSTSILGNFFTGTSHLHTESEGSSLTEQLEDLDEYLNGVLRE